MASPFVRRSPYGTLAAGLGRGAAPRRKGFTPFKAPTGPPAGSYDPALDAQLRASQRGYGDLQAQDATSSLYAGQDYQTAQDRENAAYGLATGRENENYGQRTADVNTQYQRLGSSQAQSANAAGVSQGGGLLAALQARQGNQAHDQSAIDVAHRRTLADLNTSHTNSLADLLSNYTRGQLGQGTQEAIAGRELGFQGQDIGAEKLFAAEQGGFVPPTPPANESTIGRQTFRRLGGGKYLLPSGKVVRRAGLRALY